MADVSFQVEGAEMVPHAVTPLLALKLRISASSPEQQIHSILLRCQIQIEVPRRSYNAEEQARLFDLFSIPEDWGRTLRSMHWTEANVTVRGFTGSTLLDLPVPCTYDFNVAATKYLDALQDGDIPLCLLFSGTVFHATGQAALQIAQISWDKEARFKLPVQVWRAMMERYYPRCVWLPVPRDLFDRLNEYGRRSGTATWERALESLLAESKETAGDSRANLDETCPPLAKSPS